MHLSWTLKKVASYNLASSQRALRVPQGRQAGPDVPDESLEGPNWVLVWTSLGLLETVWNRGTYVVS